MKNKILTLLLSLVISFGLWLYVVTNGTAHIQHRRFGASGLEGYMDGIFISEEMGCGKPDRAYFDAVAARIAGYDPTEAIIIGDSLTSDMQGGTFTVSNMGMMNVEAFNAIINPGESEQVRQMAEMVMIVLGILQPLQMLSVVASGALRGAGDVKYTARVMLLTVTCIRPVLALVGDSYNPFLYFRF